VEKIIKPDLRIIIFFLGNEKSCWVLIPGLPLTNCMTLGKMGEEEGFLSISKISYR
jgi:hypothetical protein